MLNKGIALVVILLLVSVSVVLSATIVGLVLNEREPPKVEIVNPKEGYFHFSGIPLFPTAFNFIADTVSIGGFKLRLIQVNATSDDKGENLLVWLHIDDKDMGYGNRNLETGYYEWQWTEKALGTYRFKTKAKDIYGLESDWASTTIWNFCFFTIT